MFAVWIGVVGVVCFTGGFITCAILSAGGTDADGQLDGITRCEGTRAADAECAD